MNLASCPVFLLAECVPSSGSCTVKAHLTLVRKVVI